MDRLRTDVDERSKTLSSSGSVSETDVGEACGVGVQNGKQIFEGELSNESTALIGTKNNFLLKF